MPAFSNAFRSLCLEPVSSSGNRGDLAVHLACAEGDSIQGCPKSSMGSAWREGLFSTFARHLMDGT